MPELPDVQKAVNELKSVGQNKLIQRVETAEDTIVFAGITHQDFSSEITRRKIVDIGRYGKWFYLELDGEGRFPLLHFGMTGKIQVRGQSTTHYRSSRVTEPTSWPPRFMKFILHLADPLDSETAVTEVAFLDPRRLGRIRLCTSPTTEPPISSLGFDPLLCMPTLQEFSAQVLRRSCPIKALLLDQTFSAGVGNWVADEILYNARIHPEERCNMLTAEQLQALHHQTKDVCEVAVAANAEEERFPGHWLFKHRWDKGKKNENALKLPNGEVATIKWITVGGRTSAYVEELQKRVGPAPRKRGKRTKKEAMGDEESDLTDIEAEEEGRSPTKKQRQKASGEPSTIT